MAAVRSHVANRQNDAAGQFALDVQVPLIKGGSLVVVVVHTLPVAIRRRDDVSDKRIRKRDGRVRRAGRNNDGRERGSGDETRGVSARRNHVVSVGKAAADGGLMILERIVRESQTGTPII